MHRNQIIRFKKTNQTTFSNINFEFQNNNKKKYLYEGNECK